MNELEPFAYLRHLFTELPRAAHLDELEALLPRNLDRALLQDLRQPSPIA